MKKNNFNLLRWIALFEGTSLISLLFVAMPLKYIMQMPIGVKIIGPIHGVLFLVFIVFLLLHMIKKDLSIKVTLVGMLASLIPFGSFVFKSKML